MNLSLWVSLYLLFVAIALICAWRAIMGARTPQGSVGWVVFLLSVPWIAVPAYLFFGHHRLTGVKVARRDSASTIAAIDRYSAQRRPETVTKEEFGPFEAAAQLPVLRGNAAELMINGENAFEGMFAAIDAAENYVLVQFYILRQDSVGQALRDRLRAARSRGVEVYISYDHIGSFSLGRRYRKSLVEMGAQVAETRRSSGYASRLNINYRNHRKILIVDGKIGFTGGLNVGDEYLGQDPVLGPWRDTQIALRGPMVTQLQLVFAEDWHFATGKLILDDLHWLPGMQPEDMVGLIVATGPADSIDSGALFFFAAISRAKRRVWIATPYLVPDIDTIAALKLAALRGVQVRLLIPKKADHWISWLAAHAFFDELRSAGVEIWLFSEGFTHQKVVLVDDDFASVGSANLDNRSFRLNFEVMAVIFDAVFAAKVDEMLRQDFEGSELLADRLEEQPLFVRIGAPIARLFAPIL